MRCQHSTPVPFDPLNPNPKNFSCRLPLCLRQSNTMPHGMRKFRSCNDDAFMCESAPVCVCMSVCLCECMLSKRKQCPAKQQDAHMSLTMCVYVCVRVQLFSVNFAAFVCAPSCGSVDKPYTQKMSAKKKKHCKNKVSNELHSRNVHCIVLWAAQKSRIFLSSLFFCWFVGAFVGTKSFQCQANVPRICFTYIPKV